MKRITKNNTNEFIINDKNKITIGRILILEKDIKNKSIILRLSLYKDITREFEEEILKNICQNFLVKENFFKLNIINSKLKNILSYSSLGFSLEGILLNNIYNYTHSEDEYIFGIDLISFTNKKEISFVKLETERLKLKLATPVYADDYLDYYIKNRNFLEAYEPIRDEKFYTKKGQEDSLKNMYRSYLNGDSINFAVFLEDTLIGKVQLSNILYGSFKSAILGYGLHKDYEGRGFMTEALKEVIEYCFRDLMLHRVEASTLTDNIKSQKILKKIGFEKVGLNKDYLYINGAWRDHYTYALINRASQ